MKRIFSASVLLALLVADNCWAMAKDGCGSGDCVTCHSLSIKEAGELLKFVGGTVKQISNPPIKGLWQVEIEKDKQKALVYLDYGKKHLVSAPIYSLATRQPIAGSVEAPAVKTTKRIKVSTIPLGSSIIMGDPQAKRKLYVFTDPDCPFCAKLHAELKKLLATERDLAVIVKLLPLKMHPQAYDKSRVILAGPEPQLLLEAAFAGTSLPPAGPQHPRSGVDETTAFAAKVGITGTPTLVLPDGTIAVGFKSVSDLQKLVHAKRKNK